MNDVIKPRISVVYAAYNESAGIRETIARSVASLRKQFDEFEVLIVDDCGSDGTGRIADELAQEYPNEVRVLHNDRNRGQGASLVRGFREARYELIIHNAIDYPFDLDDLRLMMPLLADADIVVATRLQRAGYSPYRLLTSFVHVNLLNLLFPLKLSDYNFVQLYRREVLEKVPPETTSTAFLTPSLLIRAHDAGFRVRSVDVTYHPRLTGKPTAGKPKVILHSLKDMSAFWLRRWRGSSAGPGRS
jgi:glycosyltransferase involved in cell wall biosynthesis